MPEGDTIFRAARVLHRALAGQRVTGFESVLPKLNRVDTDTPIAGRLVEKVEANGKWLMVYFSDGLILLTHMLMSGSWHIYRPGEKWKRGKHDMRIVIYTEGMVAVAFRVRVAEFHTADSLRRRPGFSRLGPSVLAAEYDGAAILRRLRSRPDLEVGEALLSQEIFAGVGNVFKSEICFACGVNPFRKVGTLSIGELSCLVTTAREFLRENVTEDLGERAVTYMGNRRTTRRTDTAENLWVYRRRNEPCRRCATPVESRKQGEGARTTFWCPQCQPLDAVS
jgi:endonuclease-8